MAGGGGGVHYGTGVLNLGEKEVVSSLPSDSWEPIPDT